MDGDIASKITAPSVAPTIDLEAVEREIGRVAAQSQIPGLTVSLKLGDQTADLAFGLRCSLPAKPISPETRFPSACIMKSLVSLVACELHARGDLDVNRPITDYLPELDSGRSSDAPITLAHLMSHTGGYIEPQGDDVRWRMNFDGFAEAFRSSERVFKPGTIWGYTQTGPAIVGRVIEKVTGEDPLEIIARDLLTPLDIDLRDDFQDSSSDVASSHIFTTNGFRPVRLPNESPLLRHSISARTLRAPDLLKISRILAGVQSLDFLSDEGYRLFAKPTVDVPLSSGGAFKEATPTGYGHGRALYGNLIGQTGSYVGATSSVRFDPATGASIALCINAWLPGMRDYLIAQLLHQITQSPVASAPTRCRIDRPIETWAGSYVGLMLGGGTAQLHPEPDGKLRCVLQMPKQEDSEATLWADEEGYVRGRVSKPYLAITLGYSEENDEPYLMSGLMLYKRQSPAT